MSKLARWNQIKRLLEQQGKLTVADVVNAMNISPATVRRDFIAMEEQGLLTRFHGGVKSADSPSPKVAALDQRILDDNTYKRAIARKAATFVCDHDFIYLDTSSTVYYMLAYIQAIDITIVTNSYLLLPHLVERGIRTYVLGGFVESGGNILYENSKSQIAGMPFDKAFLGVYGYNKDKGLSGYNPFEGELKKQILAQSSQSYVLADHSKFNRHGFYNYASPDSVTVITDSETPVELLPEHHIIC